MSEIRSFLCFRVGHEWYGIEAGSILEVLHFLALNELPASRPDILGLMRLREFVLPVIDLRLHFGLAAEYRLTTPIIVANTPSGLIALVADEVNDLEHIDANQIIPQETVASRYVTDAARLPDYLVLVLDVSRLRIEITIS